MILNSTNGQQFEIRYNADENFEIQCGTTVYVFQDFSIGNFQSKRAEAIFYSYTINGNERIYNDRHSFNAFENEFNAFLESEIWNDLKVKILEDFLRKICFTEIQNNNEE